jgi:hypothetical protein
MNRTQLSEGISALSAIEVLFTPDGVDEEAISALAERIESARETDPMMGIGTPLTEILSMEIES